MSTFFVSGVFNVPTQQINQNVNQNDKSISSTQSCFAAMKFREIR